MLPCSARIPVTVFLSVPFPVLPLASNIFVSSVASIHGMRRFMHVYWEPCEGQTACGTCTVMSCSGLKGALHSVWYHRRHASSLCRTYVAPRCRWLHSETSVTLSKAYSVPLPFFQSSKASINSKLYAAGTSGHSLHMVRTFYT